MEHNRCALNDFQTQAKNGGKAKSVANNLFYGLKRDQVNDKPMLVFISLIGNDVCNGRFPVRM